MNDECRHRCARSILRGWSVEGCAGLFFSGFGFGFGFGLGANRLSLGRKFAAVAAASFAAAFASLAAAAYLAVVAQSFAPAVN